MCASCGRRGEHVFSPIGVFNGGFVCVGVCVGVMYKMLDALVHKRSREGQRWILHCQAASFLA